MRNFVEFAGPWYSTTLGKSWRVRERDVSLCVMFLTRASRRVWTNHGLGTSSVACQGKSGQWYLTEPLHEMACIRWYIWPVCIMCTERYAVVYCCILKYMYRVCIMITIRRYPCTNVYCLAEITSYLMQGNVIWNDKVNWAWLSFCIIKKGNEAPVAENRAD